MQRRRSASSRCATQFPASRVIMAATLAFSAGFRRSLAFHSASDDAGIVGLECPAVNHPQVPRLRWVKTFTQFKTLYLTAIYEIKKTAKDVIWS
jgi:hypothetical protein